MLTLRKQKATATHVLSFANFCRARAHVDSDSDKTAFTLRARRDLQSLGIKLQQPNRGTSRSSDGNQKLLKGSSGLQETKHTRSGIAVLSELLIEAEIAHAEHHVSSSILNLRCVQKIKSLLDLSIIDMCVYFVRRRIPTPSPAGSSLRLSALVAVVVDAWKLFISLSLSLYMHVHTHARGSISGTSRGPDWLRRSSCS